MWKITSGAGRQHPSLHSFMGTGRYSYKGFYVNLLVIKCGLVLWQAQMLQDRWQILKVLPVFFELLLCGWWADRGIIRRNRGCSLQQQQGEMTVNWCNIRAAETVYLHHTTDLFSFPVNFGYGWHRQLLRAIFLIGQQVKENQRTWNKNKKRN